MHIFLFVYLLLYEEFLERLNSLIFKVLIVLSDLLLFKKLLILLVFEFGDDPIVLNLCSNSFSKLSVISSVLFVIVNVFLASINASIDVLCLV